MANPKHKGDDRAYWQRPARFAIADLTSLFFQMPSDDPCRQYTVFITFRGIYEWTRVSMGLLLSANFFQKSMGVHVLNGLTYNICEVFINDMLIFGSNDKTFLDNTRTVFQRCRERNVTLNAKKLIIGFDTTLFRPTWHRCQRHQHVAETNWEHHYFL